MFKVDIWTLRSFLFCLSSSVQVLLLDVTTPRESYAWNYRELATLLILSESLAELGLEPLTIGSMRKNLTIESYPDTSLSGLPLRDGLFVPHVSSLQMFLVMLVQCIFGLPLFLGLPLLLIRIPHWGEFLLRACPS